MTRIATACMSSTLAMLMMTAHVHAQSFGQSREGSGARTGTSALTFRSAGKALEPQQFDPAESSRSTGLDDDAAFEAFGTVTRTKGGEETREPASESLQRTIRGKQQGAAGTDTTAAEAPRAVFGRDDRVRITDTTQFPFSAVGIIEAVAASGEVYTCSGALIGPRTVLTTASCLYDHQSGWADQFLFAPGANTYDDTPFGVYDWETAHLLDGYISGYNGSYGSVLPYDVALLILSEPAGDYAGWFGVEYDPALAAFNANILGYPYDKEPAASQWRSTCDVPAAQVRPEWIEHGCATSYGTGGAPIYTYDTATRERTIHAIDVAETATSNIAARITAQTFDWMAGYWK